MTHTCNCTNHEALLEVVASLASAASALSWATGWMESVEASLPRPDNHASTMTKVAAANARTALTKLEEGR